jgi:hypothetical protein
MSRVEEAVQVLERKRRIWRDADEKHDALVESDVPEEELSKSELKLAKTKLGVVEAELLLAEAQGVSAGEIAKLKEEVVLADLRESAAQAKRDGDEQRLKGLREAIDAAIIARNRLQGQFSGTLFAPNICTPPASSQILWSYLFFRRIIDEMHHENMGLIVAMNTQTMCLPLCQTIGLSVS